MEAGNYETDDLSFSRDAYSSSGPKIRSQSAAGGGSTTVNYHLQQETGSSASTSSSPVPPVSASTATFSAPSAQIKTEKSEFIVSNPISNPFSTFSSPSSFLSFILSDSHPAFVSIIQVYCHFSIRIPVLPRLTLTESAERNDSYQILPIRVSSSLPLFLIL